MVEVSGEHQVIQEECRQLGTATEPGLLVNGHGVLPNGPLAAPRVVRDLLVAPSLQQLQRNLLFRRGQVPCGEAFVDRTAQPREGMLRARAPGVTLLPVRLEHLPGFHQRMAHAVPPAPEEPGGGCRGADEEYFIYDVERQPALGRVEDEVHGPADDRAREYQGDQDSQRAIVNPVLLHLCLACCLTPATTTGPT